MKCKILVAMVMSIICNFAFSADESKQAKSCSSIRAEIKNQHSINAVIVSQQTSPLISLLIGVKSQQNIAELESLETKLGCKTSAGKNLL